MKYLTLLTIILLIGCGTIPSKYELTIKYVLTPQPDVCTDAGDEVACIRTGNTISYKKCDAALEFIKKNRF